MCVLVADRVKNKAITRSQASLSLGMKLLKVVALRGILPPPASLVYCVHNSQLTPGKKEHIHLLLCCCAS